MLPDRADRILELWQGLRSALYKVCSEKIKFMPFESFHGRCALRGDGITMALTMALHQKVKNSRQ